MTQPFFSVEQNRALVFSFSDCAQYFVGFTEEPEGQSNHVQLLRDGNGKPQKFPSAYRAQETLKSMGFERAWLVMQSPYDEMIGNDGGLKCEMPLVLNRIDA